MQLNNDEGNIGIITNEMKTETLFTREKNTYYHTKAKTKSTMKNDPRYLESIQEVCVS